MHEELVARNGEVGGDQHRSLGRVEVVDRKHPEPFSSCEPLLPFTRFERGIPGMDQHVGLLHCAAQAAISRRCTRMFGPSWARCSIKFSAAVRSASSVTGSSASRMKSATVVSSLSWVRRACRQFQQRHVTPASSAPHHLTGLRVLDHGDTVSDGIEGLLASGTNEPRRTVITLQVLPTHGYLVQH
ncbi:MAG: hypothetical protein KatS3mg059_1252 [Thermomicrobiales bacterium]|nr:MAG: hypothetical protein KatS3mg059_1252 [Thermomicrobiales bacterium]